MIAGLDHVQLAMPAGGEERARAFYSGLLGMEEIPKPEQLRAAGGVWFRADAVMLHLGIEDPFTPARKAHTALLVRDLDGLGQSLRTARAPFTPDDRVPGRAHAYTEDPFGNRIELIADGDGFTQR